MLGVHLKIFVYFFFFHTKYIVYVTQQKHLGNTQVGHYKDDGK